MLISISIIVCIAASNKTMVHKTAATRLTGLLGQIAAPFGVKSHNYFIFQTKSVGSQE